MVEGDEVRLSRRVRALLEDMRAEWRELDVLSKRSTTSSLPAKTDTARRLVSRLNGGSCVRLRPEWPKHLWFYDFVQDRTEDGRDRSGWCA